jgi:predicted nucleotidyltransferase
VTTRRQSGHESDAIDVVFAAPLQLDVAAHDRRRTFAKLALPSTCTFTRPIRRAVAERHLAVFLERFHKANADPRWLHYITRIHLFGSLLVVERPTVGDVDVVVEVDRRIQGDAYGARAAYVQFQTMQRGRALGNVINEFRMAESDLLKWIRGNASAISQHQLERRPFACRCVVP